MTDPMLEALQHHVRKDEPVDWEVRYSKLSQRFDDSIYRWVRLVGEKNDTIDWLLDRITRLEQRCAELEGE